MARTFDQVLAEVTAKSDPQRQIVLNQIADVPNQLQADESAAGAKKDQAYDDILGGARRRGLGFAGIPLGEQAKYNATEYAPAIANLRTSANNRKTTLESALADTGRSDYTAAQEIFGRDRAFEEQQRQFNEQMAAQARQAAQSSSLASLYGKTDTSGTSGLGAGAGFRVPGDASKGFSFVDNNNSVINALQYSQGHQIPFRTLLQQMASKGDAGAAAGLQFIGNDGNADASKVTNPALADLYYSLTGRRVGVSRPQSTANPPFGLASSNIRSTADPLGIIR